MRTRSKAVTGGKIDEEGAAGALHYIALHDITLHYITLHYIALSYIKPIKPPLWVLTPAIIHHSLTHVGRLA